MLWRCCWRGRRARPLGVPGGPKRTAPACYLAAAANGCAAAAGRFSLRARVRLGARSESAWGSPFTGKKWRTGRRWAFRRYARREGDFARAGILLF